MLDLFLYLATLVCFSQSPLSKQPPTPLPLQPSGSPVRPPRGAPAQQSIPSTPASASPPQGTAGGPVPFRARGSAQICAGHRGVIQKEGFGIRRPTQGSNTIEQDRSCLLLPASEAFCSADNPAAPLPHPPAPALAGRRLGVLQQHRGQAGSS